MSTGKIEFALKKISPAHLLVFLAVLFGGYVRLSGVLASSFPLNDGGLFYTMTRDLIANGFRIPSTTTYNHLGIPFAYPPLQFYVAGILSVLLHWNLLDIFRILPAIFSTLSIVCFYILAKEILKDETHAGISTLIFSLIPASFDWLIMGGGITRAPAFLFALLTMWSVYRLYTRDEKRYIPITAVLAILTVLSHPETALHTASSTLVFFLFFGRNKRGCFRSLIVAGIVLVLTAPWWLTVILNQSFSPFMAAGQTGWHNFSSIFKLIFANLFSEVNLTSITVLYLIGVFIFLSEKRYFLPVWLLVIFISEPRSAPLFMTPLVAIFAALALMRLLKYLNSLQHKPQNESDLGGLISGGWSKALFAIFIAQWLFSAFATTINLSDTDFISLPEKNAFEWVQNNTPASSRFVVLSGSAPLTDTISEWFPALTNRISIGTAQGHEWIAKENFTDILNESLALQNCYAQSLDCLNHWLLKNNQTADYILVDNHLLEQAYTGEKSEISPAITNLLLQSKQYENLYDVDGVAIFKIIPK